MRALTWLLERSESFSGGWFTWRHRRYYHWRKAIASTLFARWEGYECLWWFSRWIFVTNWKREINLIKQIEINWMTGVRRNEIFEVFLSIVVWKWFFLLRLRCNSFHVVRLTDKIRRKSMRMIDETLKTPNKSIERKHCMLTKIYSTLSAPCRIDFSTCPNPSNETIAFLVFRKLNVLRPHP